MSRPPKRRPAPYKRTTVPLAGTYRQAPAHLSWDASLALEFAAAWLLRASNLKVPASGILRRALVLYAAHLDSADQAREAAAVRSACTSASVAEDARLIAELRLRTVPREEPLPAFSAVLRGHDAAQKAADLTARADALAEAVLAQRRPRAGARA